jgi:hypothetical protein
MSIRHLSYVACDRCGDPAQPGDDAEEARSIAHNEGYVRRNREDLCPRCKS